jgi:phospholipid/cholesterol/gamma-HCH transport system ATP-binding protein
MKQQGSDQKEKIKTDSQETVIQVSGLCKSFGDNHVLQGFDLTLKRGENLVVLGKSGSGKSVLIKCIVGLLSSDAGIINVLGKEITGLSHKELDEIRVKIGFLFQNSALYDSMTVRENLEFPMRRHWSDLSPEDSLDIVSEALSNVGLLHAMDMMPSELSGGMRKRVGLARTLIMKPEIVLYDEPTTGLDSITGTEIAQLMLDLQSKYKTSSIIISHDMHVAKVTSNRVIVLMDGRNYAEGTFDELSRSDDPKVKQFFQTMI